MALPRDPAAEQQKKRDADQSQYQNAMFWNKHVGMKSWIYFGDQQLDNPDPNVALQISSGDDLKLLADGVYGNAAGDRVRLAGNAVTLSQRPESALGASKDWSDSISHAYLHSAMDLAMDLLKYKGANTIVIHYTDPKVVKYKDLMADLKSAEAKGLSVEFDTVTWAGIGNMSEKEREKINVYYKSVNEKGALAKTDRDFEKEALKYEDNGVFGKANKELDDYKDLAKQFPNPPLGAAGLKASFPDVVDFVPGVAPDNEDKAIQKLELIDKEVTEIQAQLKKLEQVQGHLNAHLKVFDPDMLKNNIDMSRLEDMHGKGGRQELLDKVALQHNDLEARLKVLQDQAKDLKGNYKPVIDRNKIAATAGNDPEALPPSYAKLAEVDRKLKVADDAIKAGMKGHKETDDLNKKLDAKMNVLRAPAP